MENKNLIRISYVISGSEIGGTEKMLIDMAENLPSEVFYPPCVFAIRGEGTFTGELRKKGIRVRVFDVRKKPLQFIGLIMSIKRELPDILHSFLFYGNLAGRLCGRILGIKVVISSQRSTDDWRRKIHWLVDGLTARWADFIISNSYSGKDVLVEKSRIPPAKITVIPNGIKTEVLSDTFSPADFGILPGQAVVGTVGNLRTPKGHIHIVEAAPAVLAKFPGTKFVIVGQGELRRNLEQEAGKRGIAENFIFTGFIKNAARVTRLFDIFVFPSLWEGCPVGVLEAMGQGKPCVAFSAGDVPYIIRDGIDGLLISGRSSGELAKEIIKLLGDEDLRIQMGANAKKRVFEHFSFDGMMNSYVSFYKKAVALKAKNG